MFCIIWNLLVGYVNRIENLEQVLLAKNKQTICMIFKVNQYWDDITPKSEHTLRRFWI